MMKVQTKILLRALMPFLLLRAAVASESGAIDVNLNMQTTAVVNMRKSTLTTAEVIQRLPANTKLLCSRRTEEKDEINDLKAHWYFCTLDAHSGWIYGGYLTPEMVFQRDKNIFFEAVQNKTVAVNLELSKDLSFRLHVLQKNNPKANLKTWSGTWSWENDQLTLFFDSPMVLEQELFFKKTKTASPGPILWEKIKPGAYKISTQEGTLILWGVPCKISTVFD